MEHQQAALTAAHVQLEPLQVPPRAVLVALVSQGPLVVTLEAPHAAPALRVTIRQCLDRSHAGLVQVAALAACQKEPRLAPHALQGAPTVTKA